MREPRTGNEVPSMTMVAFDDGAIQIDALIVAEGPGIEPSLVLERLRK